MAIEQIFGMNGPFAKVKQDYTPRTEQVKLAVAIEDALESEENFISEAPVGVGKSLAYLTPAIMSVNSDDKDHIIVVTSGITLQEQLINKDLPLLAKTLPKPFTFALLKGINNYLCIHEYETRRQDKSLYAGTPQDQSEAQTLESWIATTKTGDRTSLPIVPQPHMWDRVSTSADRCLGDTCPKRQACYALKAREEATKSNIIVCNYHIFLADLKIRSVTGGESGILPDTKAVILDEAHRLPDIARDFFGFSLGVGAFSHIRQRLQRLQEAPAYDNSGIQTVAEEFFEDLHKYMSGGKYKAYLRDKKPVNPGPLLNHIKTLAKTYAKELTATPETIEQLETKTLSDDQKQLRRIVMRLIEIYAQIQNSMDLAFDNMVLALEDATPKPTRHNPRPTPTARIVGRMIDVSGILGEHLFESRAPVIMTSATVQVNGSFDFYKEEVGLGPCREIVVKSPFNYEENCFCVLPDGMPDPTTPSYQSAVDSKIIEFTEITKGRTLGLFTSYRSMDSAYNALKRVSKYRVLKQGDMPNDQLIAEFKKDINSILLGTHSFWEGVDVPGEACSSVIIDRLPFKHMDDPMTAYRKDNDKDYFKKYYVPHGVIMFRQGIGRLIRTTTDRGILVILDPRVRTKNYGPTFLNSMPRMNWTPDPDEARQFMNGTPLSVIVG